MGTHHFWSTLDSETKWLGHPFPQHRRILLRDWSFCWKPRILVGKFGFTHPDHCIRNRSDTWAQVLHSLVPRHYFIDCNSEFSDHSRHPYDSLFSSYFNNNWNYCTVETILKQDIIRITGQIGRFTDTWSVRN